MKIQVPLKRYWPELLTAVAVFLVFSSSLTFGFQVDWDDSYYVMKNEHLAFTIENFRYYLHHGVLGFWSPVTMYSLMLDAFVWGGTESAFGFRLTNLLLHSAAALLFVNILRHLGLRAGLAFACAMLWAVSPQRLESVVWISERKDVLSIFLALLSFRFLIAGPEKIRTVFAAILCFLLSLAAKPSAVGLPVAAAVWLCWKNPRYFNWKVLLCGFFGMLAAAGGFAWILHFRPALEPFPRWLSVLAHNLLFYSVNGIFPIELNPCYPFVDWSDFWMVPVFFGIAAGLVLLCRNAGMSWKKILLPLLAFSMIFGAFFAPFTGVFVFNPTDYADRYSYFPNLAVWACLGYFAEQLLLRRPEWMPKFRIGGILLGLFMTGSLFWHMPFWKDSASLASWAVYSDELPNDHFLLIHAKYGIINQNPIPIREALIPLQKKLDRKDFPRNSEKMQIARRGTVEVFLLCAEILEGKFAEAAVRFDRFCPQAKNTLLVNKDLYESHFKYLLMQFCVMIKDEKRLAAFEEWGASYRDEAGNLVPDYSVTAFLKYHRKDYRGAIADWEKLLEQKKNAPDIEENIRRAKMKLSE